jgi:hypothetical protein
VFLILVHLSLCFSLQAAAGDDARADIKDEFSWRGVPGDFLYVLKAPSRMTKTEGVTALVLAGVTAGLIAGWDEDIDDKIQRRSGDFPYTAARELSEIGHEYGRSDARVAVFFGGLSGAMLAGGVAFGDDKLVKTTALMAESFIFTLLATGTIKLTAGRDRPCLENGPNSFEYLKFNTDRAKQSMPSGHASTAFAMMTVIAKRYPSWWVRIPAYTLALGASLERVDSRQHWTSDVFLGAVLGYFISSAVVERHSGTPRPPRLAVNPGRACFVLRF